MTFSTHPHIFAGWPETGLQWWPHLLGPHEWASHNQKHESRPYLTGKGDCAKLTTNRPHKKNRLVNASPPILTKRESAKPFQTGCLPDTSMLPSALFPWLGTGMISRINTAWVIPVERPLVGWLAAKLPAIVTPDHLTLTGFVGALLCGMSYGASWLSPNLLWLASGGLIINWFGDSLDGTLARFRKIERPQYGFFVDSTIDLLSQLCIFLGLGVSPYTHFGVACLGLIAYLMATCFVFIKAMSSGVLQIGYFGIGLTELRLALILYNLFLLTIGPWSMNTPIGPISPTDGLVSIAFAAVLVSLLVTLWSEARRLAKEEAVAR